MSGILQFPHLVGSFDPEALRVLGAAYDLACADLCSGGYSDEKCEAMAARIIDAGMKGQRDIKTLYAIARDG